MGMSDTMFLERPRSAGLQPVRCREFVSWIVCVYLAGSASTPIHAESPERPSPEQIEFFETRVRPLLAEHCFECHSSKAKKVQGGLKLDSRDAALKGGDSGVGIVPGEPDRSTVIDAVRWKSIEMPPKGKLAPQQIETLVKWVQLGAPWPNADDDPLASQPIAYDFERLRSEHWAWKPVSERPLPSVESTGWVNNEIDLFVLATLEANRLRPSPASDARTLIRRAYFDLIGLPPSPQDVDAFQLAAEQNRQLAFSQLVDRLLAMPQYGERWGRYWLDVARYSDGFGGFLDGAAMPHAWRYRDWVVQALNEDLPIDQFIKFQVAGDLMDPPQGIPTGFIALGPTYISDGGDPDATAQAMSETLDDRVDTVSRGLLGLTVSCARCHDHKFDPIPQLDYYSLAGVFQNTRLSEFPLVPTSVVDAYREHQAAIQRLEKKIHDATEAAKKEKRDLNDGERQQLDADKQEIARLRQSAPPPYPVAHAIADSGSGDMKLAIRGNLRKPGPVAPRRFLRILRGEASPLFTRGSGRLDLAEAIASRENPLTARVFVNRVWMHHFGRGLVRTPSNFGKLGESPTHPELLDWLTTAFMDEGWSLKQLHRRIVLSATYQMGSAQIPEAFAIDGDNLHLWRMNPRQLDVEAWRDAVLKVTGELDQSVGGPPVEELLRSRRRTVYGAVSRNGDRFSSEPFLRLFDFPLPRATIESRKSTIVPQQSLFLMNSPFMAARARALARRLSDIAKDDRVRIDEVYSLLYGRQPTAEERSLGTKFLEQEEPASGNDKLTRWEQYCQVLLSANEFMHIK